MRIAPAASVDVVHVPYTYFPDAVGGTEVYVAGLAETLRAHGVHSAIAAAGEVDDAYRHDGAPVFRFATARRADLSHAYGAPDPQAAQSFRAVIARQRPRIVHLHAYTAAVSPRLVDVAHETGAKVVLTYHTPTVSCARGTMMWMGRAPCDGKLYRRRCTLCTLAHHGVPPLFRDAIARTPRAVGDTLGQAGLAGGVFTALRRVPNASLRFAIYGIRQPGCEAYAAKLERAAAKDPRVALLPALPPSRSTPRMAGQPFLAWQKSARLAAGGSWISNCRSPPDRKRR